MPLFIVCGVGIRYVPLGSFVLRSCSAIGLMLDPPHLTCTPPKAVGILQPIAPMPAGDLSLVRGGRKLLENDAGLRPLTCRLPWYEPKTKRRSLMIGAPKVPPN